VTSMAKRSASKQKVKPAVKKKAAAKSASAGGRSKHASRRRAKIGDIFEVQLTDGRFAYIQFVFDDRRRPPGFSGNGPLVRALPGNFLARPSEAALVELVARSDERFLIHFPCTVYAWRGSADASSGGIDYVVSAPVPERLQRLPRFKSFNQNETGRRVWYVKEMTSEGFKSTQLGEKLPQEMLDDPLPWVVNLPALVEKIESGWTHRTVVRDQDIGE
jgi:hypothetical protein